MNDDEFINEIESRLSEDNGHRPMSDDIVASILSQENAEMAILAALGDDDTVTNLASVPLREFHLLCVELENRTKVKHVRRLEKTVDDCRRRMLRAEKSQPSEPEPEVDVLAELAAMIDSADARLEDLAGLLNDIVDFLTTYVWFPIASQPWAVALWTMHTYVLDAAWTSPRLSIRGPSMRCGKTRLLEVLEMIVCEPLSSVNITPAVLFRLVGSALRTVLLDEIDTIFGPRAKGNEELRGLIDAGQRRGGKVFRLEGDTAKGYTAVELPVFGPVALTGIGRLPSTVEDRAIVIELARKQRNNRVVRFRSIWAEKPAEDLRGRMAAWALRHTGELKEAEPELPGELGDRQQDGWEPLLAIAEAAGGQWPQRARTAALQLYGRDVDDEDSIRLLEAVWRIFEDRQHPEIMSCHDIATALNDMEEEPWNLWRRGQGIRPYDVGRILKEFHVVATQTRADKKRRKCVSYHDLCPVWSRYLGDDDPTPGDQNQEVPPQEAEAHPGVSRDTPDAEVPPELSAHTSLFDLAESEDEEE